MRKCMWLLLVWFFVGFSGVAFAYESSWEASSSVNVDVVGALGAGEGVGVASQEGTAVKTETKYPKVLSFVGTYAYPLDQFAVSAGLGAVIHSKDIVDPGVDEKVSKATPTGLMGKLGVGYNFSDTVGVTLNGVFVYFVNLFSDDKYSGYYAGTELVGRAEVYKNFALVFGGGYNFYNNNKDDDVKNKEITVNGPALYLLAGVSTTVEFSLEKYSK